MSVFRINKTNNYTVISNDHLKNRNLSLKAKGLLTLMLSLPENWDYSIAGLTTLSADGRDSVSTALKELEKNGYLIRTKVRNEYGRIIDTVYDIFEYPKSNNEPQTEFPEVEGPKTEITEADNPEQLSTYKNKYIDNKVRKYNRPSYNDIIDKYTYNEELRNKLKLFVKQLVITKKKKNTILTNNLLLELLNDLDRISRNENEKIEVVNQSVKKGYQLFYPLSSNNNSRFKSDANNFNNFEQREYDFDELEKILLDN